MCSSVTAGTHQSSQVIDTIIEEITAPLNSHKEEKNPLLKWKTAKLIATFLLSVSLATIKKIKRQNLLSQFPTRSKVSPRLLGSGRQLAVCCRLGPNTINLK